tara:strand:- start:619 stop:1296 length:678 start_codon:yes stop_codon:yes gene_type:complete
MAYRDPTFNANLFTDLLSTYLTNQSSEREKYFKAEQTLSKPQYRTSGGNIIKIDPRTNEATTIYEAPKEKKEPKFEEFPQMDKDGNPTGMTIKGQFTGTNESFVGVPLGYEPVGKKAQFKPEDPEKRDIEIQDKRIARLVSDRKQLLRRKNRNFDYKESELIRLGLIPKDFSNEDEKRLEFIEKQLTSFGFEFFDEDAEGGQSGEGNNNSTSPKKINFWERNVQE